MTPAPAPPSLTAAQRRLLTQLGRETRPVNGYGAQWKSLDRLCNLGLVEMIERGEGAGKFRITNAGRAIA